MKILKSILLIAITIISLNLFSQTENDNKSKFSIGITAGPNYSNWYYKSNQSSGKIDTRGRFLENFDGLSLGIVGEYKINNKLALKSGLLTSNTIIKVIPQGDIFNPFDSTFIYRPLVRTTSLHYINIPFLLRFNYLETNKVKLFVNGGLINKFLLYRKSRGAYEDTGEEAPELDEGFFVDYLVYYLG